MNEEMELYEAANAWFAWVEKSTRLGIINCGDAAHDVSLSVEGILRERVKFLANKITHKQRLYEELEERLVKEINELQGVDNVKS